MQTYAQSTTAGRGTPSIVRKWSLPLPIPGCPTNTIAQVWRPSDESTEEALRVTLQKLLPRSMQHVVGCKGIAYRKQRKEAQIHALHSMHYYGFRKFLQFWHGHYKLIGKWQVSIFPALSKQKPQNSSYFDKETIQMLTSAANSKVFLACQVDNVFNYKQRKPLSIGRKLGKVRRLKN